MNDSPDKWIYSVIYISYPWDTHLNHWAIAADILAFSTSFLLLHISVIFAEVDSGRKRNNANNNEMTELWGCYLLMNQALLICKKVVVIPTQEIMFLVALVCVSVCFQHYSKSYERIVLKFVGGIQGDKRNRWLDFWLAMWITIWAWQSFARSECLEYNGCLWIFGSEEVSPSYHRMAIWMNMETFFLLKFTGLQKWNSAQSVILWPCRRFALCECF